MTRRRISSGQLSVLTERMSERDLCIVETLRQIRMATTHQLRRLYFYAGTQQANARQAQKTLARLAQLHILARAERRVGGPRSGSASSCWTLGVVGQRLAGGVGPSGNGRPQRPWSLSSPFFLHVLTVSELLVRLVEAEREGRTKLDAFQGEPACWRPFTGLGGAPLTLKPDAFVRLATEQFEDFFFIEVDRGTAGPSALSRKLALYRQYWQAGAEQARSGVFPQVLWLVPDARRYEALVELAGRQPADSWQLFQVALFDQALDVMTGKDEP